VSRAPLSSENRTLDRPSSEARGYWLSVTLAGGTIPASPCRADPVSTTRLVLPYSWSLLGFPVDCPVVASPVSDCGLEAVIVGLACDLDRVSTLNLPSQNLHVSS
jgi:hypothetical protein